MTSPLVRYSRRELRELETMAGKTIVGRTGAPRVRVYLGRSHPYADKAGLQWRARLVAMAHLGRRLATCDHVHHINGKTDDDRVENFELLAAEFHGSIHCALTPIGKAVLESDGKVRLVDLEVPGVTFAAFRFGPIISVRPIRAASSLRL